MVFPHGALPTEIRGNVVLPNVCCGLLPWPGLFSIGLRQACTFEPNGTRGDASSLQKLISSPTEDIERGRNYQLNCLQLLSMLAAHAVRQNVCYSQ